MKAKDLILMLMKQERYGLVAMADILGLRKQNLWARIHRGGEMKIDLMAKILDITGYKIVVMPKAKKTPPDCIDVTIDELEETE